MAHRRGFPARTQTTRRRKTAWGVGPNADALTFTAPDVAQVWTNGVVLQNDSEATIVRIRGLVHLTLTTTNVINGGFAGAAGIGIATAAAFAAGQGSLPSPITEVDWDGWMWHSFFDVRSVTGTIADGANAAAASQIVEIDGKAMRKFTTDMVVFGSAEMSDEVGVAQASFGADCRMLFKLP